MHVVPGRSAWWEAPLVAVVATCLYLALGSGEFYKTDGVDIVWLLDEHLQGRPTKPWPHPWHVGYLPALAWFQGLTTSLGLEPDFLALGAWFSALGAGLGVGFCHAAFCRLAELPQARLATAFLALCPTVLLFATVVEFHGPLLAPLGACVWWTARQVGRPSWGGMVLLGGSCHLAFLCHGQALFLPLWLSAFYLARRGERCARRDLQLAATAGAVHVALWLALPRLLPAHYGHWADLAAGFAAEASTGRPQSLAFLPEIVWQEWLRPLAPMSWLALGALFVPGLRREAVAFVLGLAPFLYVSVRQLVDEPEFGAYLLPLLPGAALLVARLPLPRIVLWFLLAATVANGLTLEPWRRSEPVDDLAVEVERAEPGGAPFVLIGSHRELAVAYETFGVPAQRRDPLRDDRFLWVRAQASARAETFTPEQALGVEHFLKALQARGRAVLITRTALASLDDPRAAMLAEKATLELPPNEAMAGPRFAAHLRTKFELRATASPLLLRIVPR